MIRVTEQIMDRFIPSSTSQQIYKSIHQHQAKDSQRLVHDESILDMNTLSDREGAGLLLDDNQQNCSEKLIEARDTIADALNFHHQGRVFTFTPTNHSGNNFSADQSFNETRSHSSNSSMNSPMFSRIPFNDSSDILTSRTSIDSEISIGSSPKKHQQKRKTTIKSSSPYKILNAPELRNDFYSNLVSWSKLTGILAVGMGVDVCLWIEGKGHLFLDLPKTQLISCVSFSEGMNLIVTSQDGYVRLFTQEIASQIHEYPTNGKSICCITWVNGSDSRFFCGDECGEVFYFEIMGGIELKLVKRFMCHQQQICGIAISNDLKEITVGGNDNACTIWNIENIQKPVLKFYLPHQAAVKAIAYCPWSNSLLATGGGSKDRTLRFWHTTTGTLLSFYRTKGQITSLTWSQTKRQIALTFGFSNNENPFVISIFSYPELNVVTEVKSEPGFRALSAVPSPDRTSICMASNDHTVRFYKFWDSNDSQILNYREKGVFGSEIIELTEGILKNGGAIR